MTRAAVPQLEAPDPGLERELRAKLNEVETALERAVVTDSDLLSETSRHLLAAGGKRFRPMLLLLGGGFGNPDDLRLVPGAVAIELTHLATLYHDDVIDEADSRRGAPSVNARWGNTVAILTGDYLFARASEISAELGTEVSGLLARTIAVLCDGQIREVDISGRLDVDERAYMEIIRRKTAHLMSTSCRLGGMLSDAPFEDTELLGGYGESLGMGFQLSDDIMDVAASEWELGKAPGVDLREGVYTLPVLHALREGERKDELAEILAPGPPAGEHLDRALAIVRADGSLRHARAAVTEEVARAMEFARRLPEGRARDALVRLAEFIALRCGADTPRRDPLTA
jgi:heptaprenyl diphosphate synthase